MDFIKKIKNKKIIWIGLIIIFLIIVFAIIKNNINSDHMEKNTNAKVYYRTYSNNKWSKWVKDGVTSGDKKTEIQGLQIKIKTKEEGNLTFNCYGNNKWSKSYRSNESCDLKKSNLTGIKMILSGNVKKSNLIFYRVHSNKLGWMNWEDNNTSVGSTDENEYINAVEIKIVPVHGYYPDFLRDYNKDNKQSLEF